MVMRRVEGARAVGVCPGGVDERVESRIGTEIWHRQVLRWGYSPSVSREEGVKVSQAPKVKTRKRLSSGERVEWQES